jgi:o-succinylbenzoate synthase
MAFHIPDMFGMDVVNFTLYHYALSYHLFFPKRQGFLLHVIHSAGEGWGEIAPFPGRSQETLIQAQEQLIAHLENKNRAPLFPSVHFGLSCALSPRKKSVSIPLSALLLGNRDAILAKAETAFNQGYRSAKIKVSGLELKEASVLLKQLASSFSLRVDANRAFSFEEAVDLCADIPIEYIEEPTYEIDKLETFPFPYALDETLLERSLPDNCHTIVYKPSILGPPAEANKRFVFSSACETGVGIVHIAHLFKDRACGLDTYRFLENDILHTPLDFSTGTLLTPEELHVNTSLLTKVAHG